MYVSLMSVVVWGLDSEEQKVKQEEMKEKGHGEKDRSKNEETWK